MVFELEVCVGATRSSRYYLLIMVGELADDPSLHLISRVGDSGSNPCASAQYSPDVVLETTKDLE